MLEHLQANWQGYTAVLVCLLPIVVIFRRYTFPIVMYVGELVVYVTGMHAILFGILKVAAWFKVNSTMYFREKVDPGWNLPWDGFWRPELYKPQGMFYFELAMLLLILIAMVKYRPMQLQKAAPRRAAITKGVAPSSSSGYDPKRKLKEK